MKLLVQQSAQSVFGDIRAPGPLAQNGPAGLGLTNFISNGITILYILAALVFLFMLLQASFQIILSGGEKEALAKARGRITWAIIGLLLLALAFVIARVIGSVLGFDLLHLSLTPTAAPTPFCTSAGCITP